VKRTDRGVSETIGFVVTFSMIILMVGLVYTAGTGALADLREAEQTENAEYAVEALAESLGTLERGDPARTSELRVGGGAFAVTNATTLGVTVDGDTTYATTLYPGGIAYERGETAVAVSGGAVVRTDRGDAVLLRRPSFVCGPERAIVSVVTLRNVAETDRIGTSGSVVVEARLADADGEELLYPTTGAVAGNATSVTLNVTGPYAEGWEGYFESEPNWNATGAGSSYACDTEQVYVRRTTIRVRIFA
jgi:hypothetical protein